MKKSGQVNRNIILKWKIVEMVQHGDKQKNMQSGVDKGLIEMFLKMTPEERLRANDNTIRALIELRNAFKKRKTSGLRSKRSA